MLCFFFNDTATTEIYTLSLHDALPICLNVDGMNIISNDGSNKLNRSRKARERVSVQQECRDRKSGSAGMPRPISYAVFCLKKKIKTYKLIKRTNNLSRCFTSCTKNT